MSDFIKTADSAVKLSGIQKAAILMSELYGMYDTLIERLKLSQKETRALNREFKRLGKYDRNDEEQVRRENAVLEETLRFGMIKGIYTPPKKETPQEAMLRKTGIRDMAQNNPDSIAKILNSWLDKE